MTKDVLVSISGMQYDDLGGNPEPIEVITPGDYFFRNNKHYVLFDEVVEGTSGVTKNTLKISPKEVSLNRRGATNVQMIFSSENKTVSSYATPFGNLLIGIETSDINCEESEDRISLVVDYDLDVNYEFLAECKLKVDISPRNERLSLLS